MGTPLEPREEQVEEVLDRLYEEYPDSTISLNYSNRLELLIAVILSAQCTDERVNKVCADLFETYETPEDYANAPQEDFAEAINSITYYNNKAKYIRSACADIAEQHDGEVPDTMSELTELAGVGRKTANVVLQHGHDVVEDRRRHPRPADHPPARDHGRGEPEEDRTGPPRRGSRGGLAAVHASHDRPRPRDVHRDQPGLRRLRARGCVPLGEGRRRRGSGERRGVVESHPFGTSI